MNADGLSEEERINAGKFIRDNIKKSRLDSKHKQCLICGATTSFCDSHTVPKFCLYNISVNGMLLTINAMVAPEILDIDSGVKKSGIFRIICANCDNTLFQGYEKTDAYKATPNHAILNQIALKNALRDIYKHEAEIAMFKQMQTFIYERSPQMGAFASLYTASQIRARSIDVKECYGVFEQAKNSLENENEWIELYTYDKLNYVVPIAFQGMIALITGVNGELINNIYEYHESYVVEYLHLAIFPLKNESVVITFSDKKNSRMSSFKENIKKLSTSDRLKVINRILFWYTEDYFLSPNLSKEIISL